MKNDVRREGRERENESMFEGRERTVFRPVDPKEEGEREVLHSETERREMIKDVHHQDLGNTGEPFEYGMCGIRMQRMEGEKSAEDHTLSLIESTLSFP